MIEVEGRRIDLDMTPAQAMASEHIRNQEDLNRLKAKRKARAGTQYPLIDVYDFRVRLAMMIYDNEGCTSHIKRFTEQDQLKMGISRDMLSGCQSGWRCYQYQRALSHKRFDLCQASSVL